MKEEKANNYFFFNSISTKFKMVYKLSIVFRMESILEYQIKTAIEKLKDVNFQVFIEHLFLMIHGNKFNCVKQKRDDGCDGIIDNEKVIAVYAPENHDLRLFKNKVKSDHDKYLKNWKAQYPKWMLIYNGEFTAGKIKFIDTLDKNAEIWDIKQILYQISQRPWSKIREISLYLDIDENYFINDLIKTVIDDLLKLKDDDFLEDELTGETPPYIYDKVTLNYDEEDIQGALTEYEETIPFRNRLKSVLQSYSDLEISKLKLHILRHYNMLGGDFKIRLNHLTDILSERNKNDAEYNNYVRVILIYCFEICLIGKKTEGES